MTAVLRAFSVTEEDENSGAIIFARHAIVAAKAGANEYADGDLGSVSCRRAPWADEYAGKPLPARVMIGHGWHFECSGCGARIDEDYLGEKKLPLEGVIGTQYSAVYCGKRCCRRDLSLTRRRKAEEQRAIDAFKAIVRKRFPDADFCDDPPYSDRYRERHHAYVVPGRAGWQWQQVVVSFRFPGMKIAPAHLRFDHQSSRFLGPPALGYTCCNGDREAFEAYAAATKTRPSGVISGEQHD